MPLNKVPPARINDRRVASNRQEEIEYELQSDNYIREQLLEFIEGKSNKLETQCFVLKEKSEFLYSCAVPLTLDIFMNPVKINWDTSWEPPKLYFHLLDYKDSSVIILSWHSKYDKFAKNYIGLIKSLSPTELKSVLFAYFCFNNMGLAVNPEYLKSIPIEMNKRIRKEVRDFRKTKKLKSNFNKTILGYNIGSLTIE